MTAQLQEELKREASTHPALAKILTTAGSTPVDIANALVRAGWPDDGLIERLRAEPDAAAPTKGES